MWPSRSSGFHQASHAHQARSQAARSRAGDGHVPLPQLLQVFLRGRVGVHVGVHSRGHQQGSGGGDDGGGQGIVGQAYAASLAMQLTVAGAITTMSARRARATCSLANSELTS